MSSAVVLTASLTKVAASAPLVLAKNWSQSCGVSVVTFSSRSSGVASPAAFVTVERPQHSCSPRTASRSLAEGFPPHVTFFLRGMADLPDTALAHEAGSATHNAEDQVSRVGRCTPLEARRRFVAA